MPNRIMRLGLLTFGQVWALNQAHTIIPVYGRHHTWKCHAKSVRKHFFYVLIVRKVSHAGSVILQWVSLKVSYLVLQRYDRIRPLWF